MNEILEVDLLEFENGSWENRKAVVDGTRRSLSTGFVLVKHDLSEDLIDTAYGMFEDFYGHTMEEKNDYHDPSVNGQTGYSGIGHENAAGATVKDFKEMLNYSTPLPENHPLPRKYPISYPQKAILPEELVPGITEVVEKFHNSMANIQKRFLRVIALGLGADEFFFDKMVDLGPTLTRSLHYPPISQAPDTGDQYTYAESHLDINLITCLPRATRRGLQVLIGDDWVDVVAPDGYAIINKGIMLDIISNSTFPGGYHRVIADDEAHTKSRFSLVQFCHPRPSTILAPLASCVSEKNPQKFFPISADDALSEVLYDIGLLK